MKRLDYEAPTMELIVVEMENGFLEASVVIDATRSSVSATGHESGGTFDFDVDTETDKDGYGITWD